MLYRQSHRRRDRLFAEQAAAVRFKKAADLKYLLHIPLEGPQPSPAAM